MVPWLRWCTKARRPVRSWMTWLCAGKAELLTPGESQEKRFPMLISFVLKRACRPQNPLDPPPGFASG